MKVKVTIATILHRHGEDVLISEQGRIAEKVYEWVQYWWGELGDVPMPEDHQAAIDLYFSKHSSETVEYHSGEIEFKHPYEDAIFALYELNQHEAACGLCPGNSCNRGDFLRRVLAEATSEALAIYEKGIP